MTVEIQSRKPFTTPMLNLDEAVIDMCEACGGPIMDGQPYNYDDDSVT